MLVFVYAVGSFFQNSHARVGTPADEKLLHDESISGRTSQVLYRGLGGDTYIWGFETVVFLIDVALAAIFKKYISQINEKMAKPTSIISSSLSMSLRLPGPPPGRLFISMLF